MAELAIDVLCFHRVTGAYGVEPPDQSLHGSHAHGHQAHQVEHDAVEDLQFPADKEPGLFPFSSGLIYEPRQTVTAGKTSVHKQRLSWVFL